MITDDIFRWARRTPNKIAAVYNGDTVTYRTFATLIAMARGFFIRHGRVGPGLAIVGSSHRFEFWIWSLALRSLGLTTMAASSAADVEKPLPEGVRFVVATPADSTGELLAVCRSKGLDLVSISINGEAPIGLGAGAPAFPPGGHILQTSGTTGTFKRVLFDPGFEAEFMRIRRRPGGAKQNSIVSVFSYGAWTGIGYKSPVASWMVGATVVFYQGPEPHKALRYPGVTHASVVPTDLDAILAAPEGSFPRSDRLRLNVTGGTITQRRIDEAKARIAPILCNVLGATEVNTFGFTTFDTPDDHRWHQTVPEVEVQIVDELDRPVPAGEIGKVRVGTANGPTGYFDDEPATRSFFKDGYFYPGDLGIVRADGRLALQGRVTDVINLGGRKVSPAPIEDRLRELLAVTGVCLFSMQDEAGDEEVHVILESSGPIPVDRLSAALRQEIRARVQVRVHQTTALPRNAMGKVLRLAAREQTLTRVRARGPNSA